MTDLIKILFLVVLFIIGLWVWNLITRALQLVQCPFCQKSVDREALVCPYCHRNLKKNRESATMVCAQCGQTLQHVNRPCPNCGSNWMKPQSGL